MRQMKQSQESELVYAHFRTDLAVPEGETPEIIAIGNEQTPDSFYGYPDPSMTTLGEYFLKRVEENPEYDFLGKRDISKIGAPYVWKTRREICDASFALARGIRKLGLAPKIEVHGESYSPIGLMMINGIEFTEARIAAALSSLSAILLMPRIHASHLVKTTEAANCQTIIVSKDLIHTFLELLNQPT